MRTIKIAFISFFCLVSIFSNAQSIGFNAAQSTICYSATSCAIRTTISSDVAGAVANTVKIKFTPIAGVGTTTTTLTYSGNPQDVTMIINPSNLLGSVSSNGLITVNSVSPGTVNTLTNAIYSVSVSYQRATGGTIVTSTTPLIMRFWIKTPPPTITAPGNSFHNNTLPVQFTIPGYVPDSLPTVLSGSKNLLIQSTSGNTYSLTLNDATTNLTLNPKQLSATDQVTSRSFSPSTLTDSLPDGKYKLFINYRDGRPHATASDSTEFTIKTSTLAPVILSPNINAVFSAANPFKINYILPDSIAVAPAIELNAPNRQLIYSIPTTTKSTMTWAPDNTIEDGRYAVKLSYQDFMSNPVGIARVDSIRIKSKSSTPLILQPQDGAVVNRIAYIDSVNELSLIADTLSITGFSSAGVYQNKKIALSATNTSNVFNYDLRTDPTNGLTVLNLSGGVSLPDGNYILTRKHKDIYGNPYVNSNAVGITVKTSTKQPVLLSPATNTKHANLLSISYLLPDKPMLNSVKLIFANQHSTYQLTLTPQDITTTQSFVWDITTSPIGANVSGTSSNLQDGLPSGVYTVTLQYQDFIGNPIQTATITSVKIVRTTSKLHILKPGNKVYVGRRFVYMDSLDNQFDINGTKLIHFLKDGKVVSQISNPNQNIFNAKDTLQIDLHKISRNNDTLSVLGKDSLEDGVYLLKSTYQSDLTINGIKATLSEQSDTIVVQANPFKGQIIHPNKVVYDKYVDTLVFNYDVKSYNFDSLIINRMNDTPTAKVDSIVSISPKKFAIFISPKQFGKIILSYRNAGAAIDSAGSLSEPLTSDLGVYFSPRIIPTISGNTSFCEGDSVTLTSTAANAYLWSNGAVTKSIVVKQGGNYSVTASYDNEVTGTSANTLVTALALPTAPIVADTSYCLNAKTIALTAKVSVGNSLVWYGVNQLGGVGSATSTLPIVSDTTTKKYFVSQLNNTTGCESPRAKITVKVFDIPNTPVIKRDEVSNLTVSNYGTNWYKDGVAIADTNSKIKPSIAGAYTAKTTLNGCSSAMSAPYYYVVTDVVNLGNNQFIKVTPNPFINFMNLDFLVKGYQRMNVEVFSTASGARVASRLGVTAGSKMSFPELSQGVYFVKVSSPDFKVIHQFKMVKL